MYLRTGTLLHNRYMIEGLLGHGGFGITYAARDQLLNVRVAIKEYLPRQLATRGEGRTQVSVFTGEARQQYDYGLRKFLEEAQAVARFAHHPNVVSARDYFEANGTAYMVMEYVEGVTLKEYLAKKGGRISFEEAKGIMMPVMDALREVHQAGMLHRDISPDNIYITTSAQVKILDFGAARYFAGEQSKSLSIILKAGYAPVEQYSSKGKQGSWTDVYAVGATVYKALTGKTPPDALDRKEEDTLEPPSRLGVKIPSMAEQALLQALAINAGQRFHTMGEFQQALLGNAAVTIGFQQSLISTPVSTSVPSFPQTVAPPSHYPHLPRRSANPAAIAAGIGAGVLGLVLVVGLIWWMVGGDTFPLISPSSTSIPNPQKPQLNERLVEQDKQKAPRTTAETVSASINRIFAKNGNIFASYDNGTQKQLTFTNSDNNPYFSKESQKVVFIRDIEPHVSSADGDIIFNEIWLLNLNDLSEKNIFKAGYLKNMNVPNITSENYPFDSINSIEKVKLSSDGNNIYFMSRAWVTSCAIFTVNTNNSQLKLISAGNSLDIIKNGTFKDYLIVSKHKYNRNSDGSHDYYYIIDNQGKEVKMLGDSDNDISKYLSEVHIEPGKTIAKVDVTNQGTNHLSQSVTGNITDNEVYHFVHNYSKAISVASIDNLSELGNFYAPVVNHFDKGLVNKSNIIKSERYYINRWPIREFSIKGDIKITNLNNDIKLVEFHMDFVVKNSAKIVKGENVNQFKIKKINNQLKIIDQQEKVIYRYKS